MRFDINFLENTQENLVAGSLREMNLSELFYGIPKVIVLYVDFKSR